MHARGGPAGNHRPAILERRIPGRRLASLVRGFKCRLEMMRHNALGAYELRTSERVLVASSPRGPSRYRARRLR